MDDTILFFKNQIETEQHTLIIDCQHSVKIYTYPYALTQMLTHLISNALQHALKI